MTHTIQRLKQRRDCGEIDGFTLIEILVIIIVLGILSAVVIWALGGFTGKSATAACQADGATVSSAIADFHTENPGTPVSIGGLLNGTSENGDDPYIDSWPNNAPHYAFEISTGVGAPGGATAANQLEVSITPAGNVDPTDQTQYNPYTGPSSCVGVG
jgi:general secretion pathway protein G